MRQLTGAYCHGYVRDCLMHRLKGRGGWRERVGVRGWNHGKMFDSHTSFTLYIASDELHCNENPIHVFPEKELRGLRVPIFTFERFIYSQNARIGPHIFLQQYRQAHCGNTYINLSQTNECGNWDTGLHTSFSGNICFEFLLMCLCSVLLLFSFS